MDTIIITGSSGFIGFSLSKYLLENGYHVIGIDKQDGKGILAALQNERHRLLSTFKNFTSIRRDLSNDIKDMEFLFTKAKCIVHLAAIAGVRESNQNPIKYIKNNIEAFSNVIDLAVKSKVRHFIFASSSSVYGDANIPKNGFDEGMRLGKLQSIYAMTKLENEIEASIYSQMSQIKITGLRFFSVYGPFGRPDMAPWIFADSISNDLPTLVYGKGLMKRDFTYIDDVVKSIRKVIEQKHITNYEIYNIGCSSPQSVLTLLKTIESSLGKKARITFADKDPADVKETFANMKKFFNEYDKNHSVQFETIENGIKKFCVWFCNFYDKNQ